MYTKFEMACHHGVALTMGLANCRPISAPLKWVITTFDPKLLRVQITSSVRD